MQEYKPSLIVTKDKYIQYIKLANGFCLECQKPIRRNYYICSKCNSSLSFSAFGTRVYFSKLTKEVINYVQHLHRTFFKCNAPYQHRGVKEHRIRNHITQETIEELSNKLHIELTNTKDTKLSYLYNSVKDTPNLLRRLLYNMTLYGIGYYILDSKLFDCEASYQVTQIRMFENQLVRTYIRLNQREDNDYTHIRRDKFIDRKLALYILNIIEPKVSILLSEIYKR